MAGAIEVQPKDWGTRGWTLRRSVASFPGNAGVDDLGSELESIRLRQQSWLQPICLCRQGRYICQEDLPFGAASVSLKVLGRDVA